LDLDPDHPDALLAEGTYYYVQHDYARATKRFEEALKMKPQDDRIIWSIAATHRRQGEFDEAVRGFEKCLRLSPRNPIWLLELGITYEAMQLHRKADSCASRAIALAPDQTDAYVLKADVNQSWKGHLDAARDALERVPATTAEVTLTWWVQGLLERDYETALRKLREEKEPIISGQLFILPVALGAAECYHLIGDSARAELAYDSARVLLESMIAEKPSDFRLLLALAFAYAGLGQSEQAIARADSAVALVPVARDALTGSHVLRDQAYAYVMAGQYERAIAMFENLMSVPHLYFGLGRLRLDPRLDPLRDHSRFQALIEKYEKERGT
jgi:serine/threonine-protein kinase